MNALENCRILLVEDSPDNQNLFKRILTKAGADVQLAENGAIALEIYDDLANNGREKSVGSSSGLGFGPIYDVIIMDIRMPILDGYEATRQLRLKGFQGPIIALTAHANPGEEERCRASGCSEFLLKPIDRQTLIQAVLQRGAK